MKPILCILAGGRSSRFGSPKTSLIIEGVPIVTHLRRRLGSLCHQCWLSVAPGVEPPPGAGGFDRLIADPVGYAGPLPAMAHLLSIAPPKARVIFAAADMPFIRVAVVQRMLALLRVRRDLIGVMGVRMTGDEAGLIEPMPCVWRAGRGAKLLRRGMSRGVRGPSQLADWKGVGTLPIEGARMSEAFANINRKADARRLGIGE